MTEAWGKRDWQKVSGRGKAADPDPEKQQQAGIQRTRSMGRLEGKQTEEKAQVREEKIRKQKDGETERKNTRQRWSNVSSSRRHWHWM